MTLKILIILTIALTTVIHFKKDIEKEMAAEKKAYAIAITSCIDKRMAGKNNCK